MMTMETTTDMVAMMIMTDHGDHDDDELPWRPWYAGCQWRWTMMTMYSTVSNDGAPNEQALEQGDADESGGISWAEFVEIWNSVKASLTLTRPDGEPCVCINSDAFNTDG